MLRFAELQNSGRRRHQTFAGFQNHFTGRFSSKFAVKYLLKIPPHLIRVVPCEILMPQTSDSRNPMSWINNKLQSSVATHLRHGGIVNNHIKKGLGLLLVCRWKKIKSVNIWHSYRQQNTLVVPRYRLWAVWYGHCKYIFVSKLNSNFSTNIPSSWIFHDSLSLACLFALLIYWTWQFMERITSQGNVATCERCGGIINNHLLQIY